MKNNGADENYLSITKNFSEDNNNIIYIIQDDTNKNLTSDNNRSFIYDINKLEYFSNRINFKYYDNDIETYIPINKSIIVVSNINELITMNFRECYYFKFKLTITKGNSNYNFEEKIFLDNNNNEIEFEKNDNNNEYKLKLGNNINSLIGNDNLYFYISEGTIDKTVYLYKSKFSLTKIGVPEYIIYPNNSLYFSDITCNLCNSIILMYNSFIDNNGIRLFSNCQFSKNSMIINGYILLILIITIFLWMMNMLLILIVIPFYKLFVPYN